MATNDWVEQPGKSPRHYSTISTDEEEVEHRGQYFQSLANKDTDMHIDHGGHQHQQQHEEQISDEEAEVQEQVEEEEEDDAEGDASDDDAVDESVQHDMLKLQNTFPGFMDKYRLIKRIGEGTFSTVYKAEDLQYEMYDNTWDLDRDIDRWPPTPVKSSKHRNQPRRKPKYVAIKKIYVTSSPSRILNELDLLHSLRGCPGVCPMVTAFRHTDQVVAILPYFRHSDFRDYFRNMTVPDMSIYLRSLFTALKWVHKEKILHRDIKPTNFLYDPYTARGVLVDFGLAERQGSEGYKPCICQENTETRRAKLKRAYANSSIDNLAIGFPKEDRRPSRRANRAGTRGFRAPEVLFKCTQQTTKIDIWSVGVILLTILSRRFPFFNSADDVEAMIEISTIFGTRKMKIAAQLHGCNFETSIPTIGSAGFSFERIIIWSTVRPENNPLTPDEELAVKFLYQCLELDPRRRISAADALEHEFLTKWTTGAESAVDDDDEVDMVEA
ncbi:uncharacterized protein PpBr36_06626 [Pyricularia pennisetigena]|uniref:uncharacterized protein n=1 Tax=Pyricularia pennisetigena TaxID=1578925 RepID=UPI0011516B96|nr:uncharacterized protein PpBr36_06626 [Pyricularia pennisetigena]TLS23371.1 hypothetical protein PpBr36_06626 [Pyricularia pennisetigena]